MPRPNADMDTLLAEGIRLATHFLGKGGGFFPFGVALVQGQETFGS